MGGCGDGTRAQGEASLATDGSTTGTTGGEMLPEPTIQDPELRPLGLRLQTIERVCARGRGDSFARALCETNEPPVLSNLTDLLALVELSDQSERAFAMTGNSTSLVTKAVSAINPRMIVFPRVGSDLQQREEMTAVGFVRGEQFVEIVSRDPSTGDLNFYVVSFEQNCSYETAGCDLANLLTEEIEHDWTTYSVYDHDDLHRTSFDCLSCHQSGTYGTPRMLRMQEIESPWSHWFPQRFGQRTESDRALLAQFAEAHDVDSQYGGIPIATITNALDEGSGAQLEALVRSEGFGDQPNAFDPRISAESATGESPTWEARFDAHLRGEAIAVPYPGVDVTDAEQRSAAVSSYRDVVLGAAPRESLFDIREIFSNDAKIRLSFLPWPDADGRAVLNQMCARCHDGRGDPSLEKNRFNVLVLDELPREIKDKAIMRINADGQTRMPPWRVGELTPEAKAAAISELQK
jgi:hypothetical protein